MSGYTNGSIIPLASPAGQALLTAATAAGTCTYGRLAPVWASQTGRRRCALRSAAVVLNALAGVAAFSEDAWFSGGGGGEDEGNGHGGSDGGGGGGGGNSGASGGGVGDGGGDGSGTAGSGGGGGGSGDEGGGSVPPRPAAAAMAAAAAASVGLSADAVDAAGMTLAQLGALLTAVAAAAGGGAARPAGAPPPSPTPPPTSRGGCWPFPAPLSVTVTPARAAAVAGDDRDDEDDGEWAAWPATLRTAVCDTDAVVVNYCMRAAGQGDDLGGHVAPVGGWEPASDRLLLLDVWPETGPCWVTTPALAAAAATVDVRSGRVRRMVELRLGG